MMHRRLLAMLALRLLLRLALLGALLTLAVPAALALFMCGAGADIVLVPSLACLCLGLALGHAWVR